MSQGDNTDAQRQGNPVPHACHKEQERQEGNRPAREGLERRGFLQPNHVGQAVGGVHADHTKKREVQGGGRGDAQVPYVRHQHPRAPDTRQRRHARGAVQAALGNRDGVQVLRERSAQNHQQERVCPHTAHVLSVSNVQTHGSYPNISSCEEGPPDTAKDRP